MSHLRRAAELALLAGAAVALAAPAGVAAGLVALCLGGWLALGPVRREAWVTGGALAAAAGLLALSALARPQVPADLDATLAAAADDYRELWREMSTEARDAAGTLAVPAATGGEGREDLLAAFERLGRRMRRAEAGDRLMGAAGERRSLLLVDPDGVPAAWAGEGLLHDLTPEAIPRRGIGFTASFGAVTLLAAEPLEPDRRPWRVVAGRSYATDRLPFSDPPAPILWSLVDDPGDATPGSAVLVFRNLPDLVARHPPPPAAAPEGSALPALEPGEESEVPPSRRAERLSTAAALAVALGLLALAVLRAAARRRVAGSVGLLMLSAVLALGLGAEVPALALGALATGLAAVAAGLHAGRRHPPPSSSAALGGAVAAVGLLFAAGFLYQWIEGPVDLAARVGGGTEVFALRLAGLGLVLGLVAWAVGRPARGGAAEPAGVPAPAGSESQLAAWLAAALVAVAASLADVAWLAVPVTMAALALAVAWARGRRGALYRPGTVAALGLLAVLISAATWESAHRLVLARTLEVRVLPALAPPEEVEVDAFASALWESFAGRDLVARFPRSPAGLDLQDLAFVLWRDSPLAFPNAASALVVEPYPAGGAPPGARSSFSLGLPLDETGALDRSPRRWERLALPVWEDEGLLAGEVDLFLAGRPWGRATYYLLLTPGFRLDAEGKPGEIGRALLTGDLEAGRVAGLPPGVRYALYSTGGRALASPWEEAPPLPPALATAPAEDPGGTRSARVRTPEGRARAWTRLGRDGWETLFLTLPGPRLALERIGTHALATLLLLAAAVGLGLLLALPGIRVRRLVTRTLSSYSKRLMVVYAALLMLPLLLVNVLLSAAAEDRLERQRRDQGEAALQSAQQVLGEYILDREPGFGLTTALDDELLAWLSRVVHHDVNLYWGSAVNASSKPELFAAGLLPKRIPGEIFARLSLVGYDLASRTNRVGGTRYLELYAPLRVPGEPVGEERLFLSVPLLAQQEEAASELAALRRQALLVTALLLTLLAAVGHRLAASFTRPLMELVEGTRRIAAGAPSLDLAPEEQELAALTRAIDEMAAEIAAGRRELVREKQVMERMVDNVTAGVVSLDRDGRVTMSNRVAGELLRVGVGEHLATALAGREALAPVAAFVAEAAAAAGRAGGPPRQRTVRLKPRAPRSGAEAGEAEVAAAGEPAAVVDVAETRRPTEWTEALAPGEPTETVEPAESENPVETLETALPVETVAGEGEGGESPPVPVPREWNLVWVPVPGSGEPAALLVVEDATEVLRAQRLAAWAEMARIIAHEIKNPLTPIRLNAEHMRQVWATDPEHFGHVFDRCAGNILAQVDELQEIASEFSAYSSTFRLERRRDDLVEAMEELVEPYRTAPPDGIEVAFESGGETVPARFDRRLLTRAVRNLLDNALRAAGGGTGDGGRCVTLRVTSTDDQGMISVLDTGPGVAPEDLPRIFDPFFSTHDTGTGLGLPIARRIAEEHGGEILAENRPEGGLAVRIKLPLI